ncbi:MAG TPA: hypothetical protein VFT74_20330 [Isosphaeraceae bacterium]|nr:hypothetical protein [Isosphaeraceae bacterium]
MPKKRGRSDRYGGYVTGFIHYRTKQLMRAKDYGLSEGRTGLAHAKSQDRIQRMRTRHPNKHIEAVLRYAEGLGWWVEVGGSHAWGRIFCPHAERDGCAESVWSTPANPEKFARFLRRAVDKCPHRGQ